MTIQEAVAHLRDMTKFYPDTLVVFPRFPPGPPRHEDISETESLLIQRGVLRFARQEFGTRTYHVDYKILDEIV